MNLPTNIILFSARPEYSASVAKQNVSKGKNTKLIILRYIFEDKNTQDEREKEYNLLISAHPECYDSGVSKGKN